MFYSVEPEGPQEEVAVTPEPQPEPEEEVESEPVAVELKQEPVSQSETHAEEKTQRAPPSPTPADTAPTMPEDSRVRCSLLSAAVLEGHFPQIVQIRPKSNTPACDLSSP